MANYDSFVFTGHGTGRRGVYDPGACSGSYVEHEMAAKIVELVKVKAAYNGLNLQYGVQNYEDNLTSGNTYNLKWGVSVHVNSAPGAYGTEMLVPLNEKYFESELNMLADYVAMGFANRGIKSRHYDSEAWVQRSNGVPVGGTDYFREIREAWANGVSLTIIEVGFITTEAAKIAANYDKIATSIVGELCKLAGKAYKQPVVVTPAPAPAPAPTTSTSTTVDTYRVLVDGVSVGAYGKLENIQNQVAIAVKNKAKKIELQKV